MRANSTDVLPSVVNAPLAVVQLTLEPVFVHEFLTEDSSMRDPEEPLSDNVLICLHFAFPSHKFTVPKAMGTGGAGSVSGEFLEGEPGRSDLKPQVSSELTFRHSSDE